MKEDIKKYLKNGLISIPFCVGFGIIIGLLFGMEYGMLACGFSTFVACDHILSNMMIDVENKVGV